MTAFSPFIPHNDRDSSMPAALFSFDIENDTHAAIAYTVASTLGNYGCDSGVHTFSRSGDLSALHLTSADVHRPAAERGDLAITTAGDGVEHVDYHVRGQWFDSLSRYWREFASAGALRERSYDKPRETANMWRQPEHGTLARRVTVEPEEAPASALRSPGTIRSARSLGSGGLSRATPNIQANRRHGGTTTQRNGRMRSPAARRR